MAEVIARRSLELIDRTQNHDKFYEILLWQKGDGEAEGDAVEIHYGRNGTKGSNTLNRHTNAYDARQEFYDRVQEKLTKGYKPKADDQVIKTTSAPPMPAAPLPTKEELAEDFVRMLVEGRDD